MITKNEIGKYDNRRGEKLDSLCPSLKFAELQSSFCPVLPVAIESSALVGRK